jgi:hypothetical protein
MSSVDGLDLRRRLGRRRWGPPRPFGSDGWIVDRFDGAARVIVTTGPFEGRDWVHASISRPDRLPTYGDLVALHRAVLGGAWFGHQLFVPASDHVNLHPYALHLWGLADGTRALPDFAGSV